MTASGSFYSLIQFCPDFERSEGINVGIAVFDHRSTAIKLTDDNRSIKKRFNGNFDDFHLDYERKAFRSRLLSAAPNSLDAIEDFISKEAGRVLLLSPRPFRLAGSVDQAAEKLFAELVDRPVAPRHERIPAPNLEKMLVPLLDGVPIRRNVTVEVPLLGLHLQAPVSYLNGRENYVTPIGFSADSQRAIEQAQRLCTEGQLIYTHRNANGAEQKLIVVASFGDQEVRNKIVGCMEEFGVSCFGEEQVDALAAKIRSEAHGPPTSVEAPVTAQQCLTHH